MAESEVVRDQWLEAFKLGNNLVVTILLIVGLSGFSISYDNMSVVAFISNTVLKYKAAKLTVVCV